MKIWLRRKLFYAVESLAVTVEEEEAINWTVVVNLTNGMMLPL